MNNPKEYVGLTEAQVLASRKANGNNAIEMQEGRMFWTVLKEVVLEPMFMLLLAACIIYFAGNKNTQ